MDDLERLIYAIPETRVQEALFKMNKIVNDLESEVESISEEMAQNRSLAKLYENKKSYGYSASKTTPVGGESVVG